MGVHAAIMEKQMKESMQDHNQPGDVIMHDRIVIDPAMQHGTPVIRGTRVPVARLLGGLAGGMTPAEPNASSSVW